jgi:hypothetical protein
MKVKKLTFQEGVEIGLGEFPSFSKTGSITGMKRDYYGKDALLVRCGYYIYNVTSNPDIYNQAH